MCSYWVAMTYGPGGPLPGIPVYGPAGTAARLAAAQGAGLAEDMSAAFRFETLTPGARRIGPFEITLDHVNHPVETFGFRIAHGGRALAYSADTGGSRPRSSGWPAARICCCARRPSPTGRSCRRTCT